MTKRKALNRGLMKKTRRPKKHPHKHLHKHNHNKIKQWDMCQNCIHIADLSKHITKSPSYDLKEEREKELNKGLNKELSNGDLFCGKRGIYMRKAIIKKAPVFCDQVRAGNFSPQPAVRKSRK